MTADVILVFGAGIWPDGPSQTMRARVDAAARLYEQGIAPMVMCSGSCDSRGSEARLMRTLLIEHGVPADAIIADWRKHQRTGPAPALFVNLPTPD